MREITLKSVVRRSSDVLASPVHDELVMMDVERGMYYALDGVGSDIWGRQAQSVRVADLCAQLQQKYAVEPAAREADALGRAE